MQKRILIYKLYNCFIDTPSEAISVNYMNYEAGNDKGNYIVFDRSDSGYASDFRLIFSIVMQVKSQKLKPD